MGWNRILIFTALLLAQTSLGQVAENRYLVEFTDKANTPFSVNDPGAFLSQRALDRRATQSIAVTEEDLPVDPEYISIIESYPGVEVLYPLKWFNSVLIESANVTSLQQIITLEFVTGLMRSPVIYGDNDYEVKPLKDSDHAKTEEAYGEALNQIDMIQGRWLHEEGFMGEGKWIGVFDGGFSNSHTAPAFEQLFQEQRILGTLNFPDSNEEVFQRSAHGSYVLSTMAANDDGVMIGTAPGASYLLCITEDVDIERRIEEANWAAAAEFADSMGIDIINTSLGYTTFDVIEDNYSYSDMNGNTALITRASDIAASKGILIVTSAGNKGGDPWFHIGAPADGDSVLAVGAVNAMEISASFSSRGPSADGRVKPNVCAQGQGAVVSNLVNGTFAANGTSFSSPIIAGMAACLWQKYPNATAWQIHQAIEQSAHLFEDPNDSLGYGIPNFEAASNFLNETLDLDVYRSDENLFTIYPNPSSGDLNISGPFQEEKITLEITDIAGRILFNQDFQVEGELVSLKSVLGSERSGVYILKFYSSGSLKQISKILKI
jgi:subtilisin family serine protease